MFVNVSTDCTDFQILVVVRADPSRSTTPSTALRASAFSGQAISLGMTVKNRQFFIENLAEVV
jgi:hypothetical protein